MAMPHPRSGSRLNVRRNILVHLKHRDGFFAEHFFQMRISQNFTLVSGILKIMLLDIGPNLADDFAARKPGGADDSTQFR